MAKRSTRARQADRDAVIESLTEAYADLQLTAAEYDARTTRALAAETIGELKDLVAGLTDAPALDPPPGPQRRPRRRPWSSRTKMAVAAGVTLSAVLVVALALELFDDEPAPPPPPAAPVAPVAPEAPEPAPDPFTRAGFETLLSDFADQHPDTRIYRLYLGNSPNADAQESWVAVASVPVPGKRGRSVEWQWPRQASTPQRSTTTQRAWDLADLDPSLVPRAYRKARALLDDQELPARRTAMLFAPDEEGSCVRVQVTNEWQDEAVVELTCRGEVVHAGLQP